MAFLGKLALFLLVVVLVLVGLNQFNQLTGGNARQGSGSQAEPVVAQNPAPPQQAEAPQEVTVLEAPANQSDPQTQATSGWSCPGSAVQNGGCLVTTTTNLVAGLCLDYDPGASSIAGPHSDVKSVSGWTRSLITGEAAWTPRHQQATATIYQDPSCPPFT
jgi:hypothetical protein